MTDELVVLLNGFAAGVLSQDRKGRVEFEYDPGWREEAYAYSLSLSMPLVQVRHRDEVVRPFLDGLLPDDPGWRDELSRRYHVSASNPFGLLANIGEDCAGAVQIVRPERFSAVLDTPLGTDVEWCTEEEIAADLRDRVERHALGRGPLRDVGYFSLAGAQPKLVLFRDEEGRWGKPRGRTPSTHIVKPPAIDTVDAVAVNEHFCLRLAAAVGLSAADSEVRSFAGETAIVVERYDRQRTSEGWSRIHQEDLCQALSIPPSRKYENEGGPGVADVVQLLGEHSSDAETDVVAFLDALALNWIIGGTDAHAKNYSLLLLPGQEVRLAPLYDVISVLSRRMRPRARDKIKLAMRIGKEYELGRIDRRRWVDLADRADLDPDQVVERVRWMVEQMLGVVPEVRDEVVAEGLDAGVVGGLATAIEDHALACRKRM